MPFSMKNKSRYAQLLVATTVLLLLLSCKKENVKKEERIPLNSFSMDVNGQLWQPSIPGGDKCKSTFYCREGAFSGGIEGHRPFYEIYAFQDPQAIDDYRAKNHLRIQITDVTKTGLYELKNSYKDYFNYILFITNEGNQKLYINKKNQVSFVVNIDEFITTKSLGFTGIKGSFRGVLYNEDNPLDSLVIENGKFKFINGNQTEIDHCERYWID